MIVCCDQTIIRTKKSPVGDFLVQGLVVQVLNLNTWPH